MGKQKKTRTTKVYKMQDNDWDDLSASCARIPCDDEEEEEVGDLARHVEQMTFDDGDIQTSSSLTNDIDDRDEEEEEEDQDATRYAFAFAEVSQKYGENQRGLLSTRDLAMGNVILMEDACVYVSDVVFDDPESKIPDPFFMEPWHQQQQQRSTDVIPEDLLRVRGGWYIALACLLIRDHEDVAELNVGDPALAMFGRHNPNKCVDPAEAYKLAVTHYMHTWDNNKRDLWDGKRFEQLYCVMQTNATLFYMPLTQQVYAAGYFPTAAFLNHSCSPNAIAFSMPGKQWVQAVAPIKKGEEITISYKEISVDVLSRNMVMHVHADIGLVQGCHCELCSQIAQQRDGLDAMKKKKKQEDDDDDEEIDMDVTRMWNPDTNNLILGDKQFASYVMNILKNPDDKIAAASFHALRVEYTKHFERELDTVPPKPNPNFKHDLAIVLGEQYCTITIHVDGQTAEDYHFWPVIYFNAVLASRIPMFHAINTGYFARAYAMTRSMVWRLGVTTPAQIEDACVGLIDGQRLRLPDVQTTITCVDIPMFVDAWVNIKVHLASVFGQTRTLSLMRRAYPMVDELCVQYHNQFLKAETFLSLSEEDREKWIKEQQQQATGTAMDYVDAPDSSFSVPAHHHDDDEHHTTTTNDGADKKE